MSPWFCGGYVTYIIYTMIDSKDLMFQVLYFTQCEQSCFFPALRIIGPSKKEGFGCV